MEDKKDGHITGSDIVEADPLFMDMKEEHDLEFFKKENPAYYKLLMRFRGTDEGTA